MKYFAICYQLRKCATIRYYIIKINYVLAQLPSLTIKVRIEQISPVRNKLEIGLLFTITRLYLKTEMRMQLETFRNREIGI